jgi:hypothetical protein
MVLHPRGLATTRFLRPKRPPRSLSPAPAAARGLRPIGSPRRSPRTPPKSGPVYLLVRPFALLFVLPACVATGGRAGVARPQHGEAAAPAAPIHVVDRRAGISLSYPHGWYRPERLTKIIYPRERLALASYPLSRNGTIGECQARHSLERIPPDGVFIYLLEFRPLRGKVWAELRRRDFPPRPSRFRITRGSLQRNLGCSQGA